MTQLSTAQVATVLGITPARVIQLANDGKIPCEVTPLGRLYDPKAIEKIRREREKNPPKGGRPKANR